MSKKTRYIVLLLSGIAASACGGASTAGRPDSEPATPVARDVTHDLTRAELQKLDEPLKARVDARDAEFPVRVTFASMPSSSDLSTLMLVRYERAAIGRVNLQTLKTIAARGDVQRITLLTTVGYDGDDA